MKFTRLLKRLLEPRRGRGVRNRWNSRLPRPNELEFSVIPATDDRLYDQDVMPALLARILADERSR
jgi:hypothetical protein